MRTPPEQVWFEVLVENKIRFAEQIPVGPYIADFLVGNIDIEIDGFQHKRKRNIKHDKVRDEYFRGLGYKVIRIPMNWHNFYKKKHQIRFQQQKDALLAVLLQ